MGSCLVFWSSDVSAARRRLHALDNHTDALARSVAPESFNTTDTAEFTDLEHSTSIHADIRALLDYTWHTRYSDSRVEFQDALIDRLCSKRVLRGDELPLWAVFTAGPMGAGKGFVISWMIEHGYLPLKNFIVIDPDAIRQQLPEWELYVAADAATAGDMTQKEAGCIAEIMGYRALRDGISVVFDGSLRHTEWYAEYFRNLRSRFHGIRIMILQIVAHKQDVLRHAVERAEATGRIVPEELVLESWRQVPRSVRALAPRADLVCRVINRDGHDPRILRQGCTAKSPPEHVATWDSIRALWTDPVGDAGGSPSRDKGREPSRTAVGPRRVLDAIGARHDGSSSKTDPLVVNKR